MNTIIPTFVLIVIFAATVWGCGSDPENTSTPETSTQQIERPGQDLGQVQIETPPSVEQEESLTNVATPSEPSSVLNDDAPERIKQPVLHGELGVQRLAISREIRNREPVDAGLMFTAEDEKLFAFVEASNAGDSDRAIFVTFRHESGHTAGLVELEIPADSPRWRTWAFSRNVQLPGLWTLLIEDEDGQVLDSVDFELAETSSGL